MEFWVSQKAENLQARVLLHGYICVCVRAVTCVRAYVQMCMLYVAMYVFMYDVASYDMRLQLCHCHC
jgi:hypothetical protein